MKIWKWGNMQCVKQKKGFTLIELLVALAVLVMLAVLVLININTRKKSGEINILQRSAQQVLTASRLYLDDNPKVTYIKASSLVPDYMTALPDNNEVVGDNVSISSSGVITFDVMSNKGATDGCAVHVIEGNIPTTEEITNTCP